MNTYQEIVSKRVALEEEIKQCINEALQAFSNDTGFPIQNLEVENTKITFIDGRISPYVPNVKITLSV